MNDLITYYM